VKLDILAAMTTNSAAAAKSFMFDSFVRFCIILKYLICTKSQTNATCNKRSPVADV
jgi:hypothetical protein